MINHCQAFGDMLPSIMVSKLLCPTCWEGLLILDPAKRFGVCGHHRVPYAVELPSWLPQEVVAALSSKFRALVVEEFKLLTSSVELPPSSGRASQESQSHISIASHTSAHVGQHHHKQNFSSLWSDI